VAGTATIHEDERLLYSFKFDGLPVGDVLIAVQSSDATYRGELRGRMRGPLRIFGDFRTDLVGQGELGDARRFVPELFTRAWAVGGFASIMTISFDHSTDVATSQEHLFNPRTGKDLPPRHAQKVRRPLPEAKRTATLDPMSAVLIARDRLKANWLSGNATADFRLPIFDGRHRYDVIVTPGAVTDERVAGSERRVLPVTAQVEPAAGFEADTAVHTREAKGRVVFSADERFLPLQVVAGNSLGIGVFTLDVDCHSNPAPCDAVTEHSRISRAQ
jgi:hypothetical protein